MTSLCAPSSKFPMVLERPSKCPVSVDQIAEMVGRGDLANDDEAFEILYRAMNGVVFALANRYRYKSCMGEDVQDLSQECWQRISRKLHLYQRAKGAKFTTWCWKVCSSVLWKKYRRCHKKLEPFVEMPENVHEYVEAKLDSPNYCLEMDMRETVAALIESYPKHSHVLSVMLWAEEGILASSININDVSQRSGVSPCRVSWLYHKVVKPFFEQRMNGGKYDERTGKRRCGHRTGRP